MPAICRDCAEDIHLKNMIEAEGEELDCSECGEVKTPSLSAASLAALIEPIMREHFRRGDFDYDGIPEGEDLESVVSQVVGQDLSFVQDVVREVINLDPYDPRSGDDPIWEDYTYYVETRAESSGLYLEWNSALEELKHSRRFFSPSASSLFSGLFSDVDQMRCWDDGGWKPVVFELPTRTKLFRARVCNSSQQRSEFFKDAARELGPPPPGLARAGRMNPEGVPVLYCAMDVETAVAEMRPAIGTELVCTEFQTTKPIRVLDFSRLEKARGKALSFLQPDFNRQVERNHFLRRLHRLISQPVVPGREAEYLITQTMAEYLAHVLPAPVQGILFASAQRANGTNVVVFRDPELPFADSHEAFPVQDVMGAMHTRRVYGVEYKERKLSSVVHDDGQVSVYDPESDFDADDEFD